MEKPSTISAMTQGEQKLMDGIRAIIVPALAAPNDLVVKVGSEGKYFAVTALVNPVDMPRVIGKAGNNVRALKGMLAHIGQRNQCFIRFHVADPPVTTTERTTTPPLKEWDKAAALKAADTALRMALYDSRMTPFQEVGDKWFLNICTVLDQTFGECLARWMHVIGRQQGVNLILCAERIPSDKRAAV